MQTAIALVRSSIVAKSLATTMAVALALSGCGGDDINDDPDPTTGMPDDTTDDDTTGTVGDGDGDGDPTGDGDGDGDTAPTITEIADQTIDEDGETDVIPFTVGDAETAAGELVVTAMSSEQGVVNDGGLLVGGSGASRTIVVTPVPNANGTATITVSVSDGVNTTDETFEVVVEAVNDEPVLSAIDDVTTPEDVAVNVTVTVADIDDAFSTLVGAVESSNTDVVAEDGLALSAFDPTTGVATLTLTPVENQSGETTITVTVTDPGGLTDTETFVLTVTPENDPPEISAIDDIVIDEDTDSDPIAFTVGDIETPDALLITGTSSNPAVIADGGIAIAGTGAERTVTISPQPNAFGTATISIEVSDGGLTAVETFLVTVNPVNDRPTISDILNSTTGEDEVAGPIAFTIGDVDDPATSLVVTATSDDQSRVADAGIALGGTGTARTITITPVNNATGPVTITVTVSDGELDASDSFVLTIGVDNDPPTLSEIADQTTDEDTATDPIAIEVADVDDDLADVVLSATSSVPGLVEDFTFTGTGASRTLVITPAEDQNGTATITVTATDGDDSNQRTFELTVTPVNDRPTISDIADQVTDEDEPFTVAFTITDDPETVLGTLTVTATSSNQAVVADADLLLGGSGGNRTLRVTPAPEASGVTTITVTVDDGDLDASDTFEVTVVIVDDPPTIATIPDVTIQEDDDVTVNVVVGDVDNDITDIVTTATSDNPALLDALVVNGTGTNRTLLLDPRDDANGTATITVSATDGNTTVTETFVLTVTAVNDVPTISEIFDITIPEDTNTTAAFTIGDVETPVGDLVVTAVSNNTTLFPNPVPITGTAPNLVVQIQPEPNQNGVAIITVSVSDGTDTTQEFFQVTVTPVDDPPVVVDDSYDGNVANVNFSIDAANGVLANDSDPDDGDSISVVETTITTAQGATVNINPDGSFTYVAKGGVRTSDSFTYTVQDTQPGTPDVTGTVSVGLTDEVVWFVDATAPNANGDGSQSLPYDNLETFDNNAADASGDVILVRNGTVEAPDGGLTLLSEQSIVGANESLSVDGIPVSTTGARATIVEFNPLAVGVTLVEMASNTAIRGVDFDAVADTAIGTDGSPSGLTLARIGVEGTYDTAIVLDGPVGIGSAVLLSVTVNVNGNGLAATNYDLRSSANNVTAVGGFSLDLLNGTYDLAFGTVTSSNGTFGARIDNVDGSISMASFTDTTSGGDSFTIANSDGLELEVTGDTVIDDPVGHGLSVIDSGDIVADFGDADVTGSGDVGSATFGDAYRFTNNLLADITVAITEDPATDNGGAVRIDDSGTVVVSGGPDLTATGGPALVLRNTDTSGSWSFGDLESTDSVEDAVTLDLLRHNVTIESIVSNDAAGDGLFVDGTRAIQVQLTGAIDVNNSGGGANGEGLDLRGTPVMVFNAVDVEQDSDGAAGVSLEGTSQTVRFGSTVAVRYIGALAVGGDAISIRDATGTVTFQGAVTVDDAPQAGLRIDNTGATIAFEAAVDVNTPAGSGVEVSDLGGDLTFDSLDIDTPGDNGLEVDGYADQAITLARLDVSSAPATGVLLANGVGGSFSITGSDGADADEEPDADSGGTVANSGDFGYQLDSVDDVSLGFHNVTGIQNDGGALISGDSVDGLVLEATDVTVARPLLGTAAGLAFTELTGTVRLRDADGVAGCTLGDTGGDILAVSNSVGTLTLSMNGCTVSNTDARAIDIAVRGNASAAAGVADSSIDSTGAEWARFDGSNLATLDVLLRDNSWSNAGADGIEVVGSDGARVSYQILGTNTADQTLSGVANDVIRLLAEDAATLDGEVSDNLIGTQGVAGSASTTGSGVVVTGGPNAVHRVLISTNGIFGVSDGAGGVFVDADSGTSADVDVTLTNNTVADTTSTPAVLLVSGDLVDNDEICFRATGNALNGGADAGLIATGEYYFFSGYANTPAGGAALNAFLLDLNPGITGTPDLDTSGIGFPGIRLDPAAPGGFTPCDQPDFPETEVLTVDVVR